MASKKEYEDAPFIGSGRVGLAVMRMQPPHRGHMNLIQQMRQDCDVCIVAFGTTQISRVVRHPFTFSERLEMVRAVFGTGIKPLPLVDIDSNINTHDWVDYVLDKVRKLNLPEPTDYYTGGTLTTWSDENFNLFRYRRNVSFPAFSNCSTNEDYGNGSAASGEDYGTVNGFLDWKDNVTDNAALWKVKVFLRDLDKINGTAVAPEFCTVDVTPRRLQNFKMEPGDAVDWLVEHDGMTIQSGTVEFEGGILTIPGIMRL